MEELKEYLAFAYTYLSDTDVWLTVFMVYSIVATFFWWTKGTVLRSAKKYIEAIEFQRKRLYEEQDAHRKEIRELKQLMNWRN